jgi:hypothetical protein
MSLSKAQIGAMIATDSAFANLVAVHGTPTALADCTAGGHAGEVCMEGNCVNGQKLVMKCDHGNGCTSYATVPC